MFKNEKRRATWYEVYEVSEASSLQLYVIVDQTMMGSDCLTKAVAV
jgi:hypothetical protein